MTMKRVAAAWLLLGVLGGCGGGLRFRDQPVIWRVDDTRSIPEPEAREFLRVQWFADLVAMRRLERALALPDLEPAWNVNALEEVPDSTWFTNRVGIRELSPEEVARGPTSKGPPRPPYTVMNGKRGGGALGFIAEDADQRTFLVKFDPHANPEMQTGANVVVNRLIWAFGYHVPADYVFELRREELVVGPNAKARDHLGDEVPYTQTMLDHVLATGAPPRGGMYRATASELVPGIPKGGFAAEGVRPDDLNDVVPHEHRRELRGLRVFAAWVNHTDMKEDNTVDAYVTEGGRRFLRHYLVDFGEAFGGHIAEKGRREDGHEHLFDWENQTKALFSFGLWTRPWEDLKDSGFEAIGMFGAQPFDPTLWREAYPYWPFMEMDATDAFWGAKIVTRFTREQIAAAVKEGKYSERGAAAYLVDTLEQRKLAIGRAFLEALSPLDAFDVKGGLLCATDLGVENGIVKYGVLELLDDEGEVAESVDIGAHARACVRLPGADGYRIVSLRSRRGDTVRPPLEVHLSAGPEPRVLGIVRDP